MLKQWLLSRIGANVGQKFQLRRREAHVFIGNQK
jgi:hypothetical protein